MVTHTHHGDLVVGQKRGSLPEKEDSQLSIGMNLLDTVELTDRVVTGNTLYCQRPLCEEIVSDGGGYLLIVKGNNKSLQDDIEFCFEGSMSNGTYRYAEAENRHRDCWEHRRLWTTDMLRTYLDWVGHTQVMKAQSCRLVKGKLTRQVRYAITQPRTSDNR